MKRAVSRFCKWLDAAPPAAGVLLFIAWIVLLAMLMHFEGVGR